MIFVIGLFKRKVMKKYRTFSLICVFVMALVYCQDKGIEVYSTNISKIQKDKHINKLPKNDSLHKENIGADNGKIIELEEVHISGKPVFNNQLDKNYYSFLNRKIYRVYPLFLEALEQYQNLEEELKSIPKKKRRAYSKRRQNELANEYEDKLKELTVSEGQIFAKLMNRATGKTVFQIIKELRGGWSAFWWNIKGRAVNIELKKEYNPYLDRHDQFVEDILQSSWSEGYLTPYYGCRDFKVSNTHK